MNVAGVSPAWLNIALAGIGAGSFDVLAASVINQVGPQVVLKAIASGLIGKAAFAGGHTTVFAGLLLQWGMSIGIAAIFLMTTARLSLSPAQALGAGALYGLPVYLVMTFVVVPLSNAPSKPNLSPRGVAADLTAMVLFGVIVAMAPFVIANVRRLASFSG